MPLKMSDLSCTINWTVLVTITISLCCKTIQLIGALVLINDLSIGLGDADNVVETSDAIVDGRLFRVMHPHPVHVELVLKGRTST